MQRYAMDAKAEFGQDAWAVERKSNIGAYVLKADAEATIARLTSERDEARASAAAAYERAEDWACQHFTSKTHGLYIRGTLRALATEAESNALAEIVKKAVEVAVLKIVHGCALEAEDISQARLGCCRETATAIKDAILSEYTEGGFDEVVSEILDQRKEAGV